MTPTSSAARSQTSARTSPSFATSRAALDTDLPCAAATPSGHATSSSGAPPRETPPVGPTMGSPTKPPLLQFCSPNPQSDGFRLPRYDGLRQRSPPMLGTAPRAGQQNFLTTFRDDGAPQLLGPRSMPHGAPREQRTRAIGSVHALTRRRAAKARQRAFDEVENRGCTLRSMDLREHLQSHPAPRRRHLAAQPETLRRELQPRHGARSRALGGGGCSRRLPQVGLRHAHHLLRL